MLVSDMRNSFPQRCMDEREDTIPIMFAFLLKKINDASIEYNGTKFSTQPFMATRYVDI